MSLTKPRAWIAGTVVVCLLLALATYFLLIGPKRAEAAELREQTDSAEASNQQLQLRVSELKAQFAELPQRQAELAAIKQALPESAELATLTRELQKEAGDAGVTLMTVVPGAPVAVVAPVSALPAAPAPAPVEGAGAPVPVAPAAPTSTLVAIPVTVTVVGSFEKSEAFLESVQTTLGRDFLISQLGVVAEQKAAAATAGRPAVKNGDVTMTVTGSVFALRPAAAVAPVPVVPAPTTTP